MSRGFSLSACEEAVMGLSALDVISCAENALCASEATMSVLSLWAESIPYGDEYRTEASRVYAAISLLRIAINELVKVREAGCEE